MPPAERSDAKGADGNTPLDENELEGLILKFLRELHRRMFDETWIWAGSFRRSDKSISPYHWTEALDSLVVRFHHELVRIHPWPNGNGRHARLAAELLVSSWGRPPFSWGGAKHETSVSELRARYLGALKSADAGEFDELTWFARE